MIEKDIDKYETSEEFELGRLDVINDLERTINFRLNFLKRIKNESPAKIAYSLENRQGQEMIYLQILDDLKMSKKKKEDMNKWAKT